MKTITAVVTLSLLAGAAHAQVVYDNKSAYMGPGAGPSFAPPGPRGPRAPDVVARSVPFDLAMEAAKTAEAACAGFHTGVVVLDAAGLPKLYYIPDGTAGGHAYTAYRKATTALLVSGPSETVVEKVKTDPALMAKVTSNTSYITYAGGLPIRAGGAVIGAIGVSGAEPSAKDEECAVAAIAKIQSRLR